MNAPDYALRRVAETCAEQGLTIKPDDAVLEVAALILASAKAVSDERPAA